MVKDIIYEDKARKNVYNGVKKVADAVKVTMWPKGKNVMIEKSYGWPTVTNDGVSVAKEIELKDKIENLGAELTKQAANKTNDAVWDGTTTTIVLMEGILKEWLKYINSWVNPFELWKWMDKAVKKVVEKLHEKSKKITTKEEIKQVATISAQDNEVWKLIADVIEEIWEDGVVSVEEWKSIWLEKEIVKGMQFDQGYESPYFITDSNKMESVIENASIIITDKKISIIKDILPLLEKISHTWSKNIVIISDGVEGEALATLVLNKLRGILDILAVKSPGFGDNKKQLLQDIAIVTGWTVISEEMWMNFENVWIEVVWKANKVISNKDKTTIVWGKWETKNIENRINQLKIQFQQTNSDYDKEKIQERIAKLSWGVAVIRVWAATEIEMKNKKYKIEDALNATRAAMEEWILPGAWAWFLKIQKELDNLEDLSEYEKIWVDIVKAAIEYPAKQIAINAGYKWDVIVEKVKDNKDLNYGFDSKTWKYVDLIKEWIIDPVKVERVVLENAVSASKMLLTTEAVIIDVPEQEKNIAWDDSMSWMWWMPGMI